MYFFLLRTTEWLGMEGTSKSLWFQPSALVISLPWGEIGIYDQVHHITIITSARTSFMTSTHFANLWNNGKWKNMKNWWKISLKNVNRDTDVKLSWWNSAKVKTIGKRRAAAAPNVIFSVAFQALDWVQLWEPEMWEIKAQPLPQALLPLKKVQSKKESLTWATSSPQSSFWPKREGVGTKKMRCEHRELTASTNTGTSSNSSNLEVINNFIITPRCQWKCIKYSLFSSSISAISMFN